MKTVQAPPSKKTNVVDEKVRVANEYIKNIDMSQLYKTVEQAQTIASVAYESRRSK